VTEVVTIVSFNLIAIYVDRAIRGAGTEEVDASAIDIPAVIVLDVDCPSSSVTVLSTASDRSMEQIEDDSVTVC
jgi:hypothetical protein